MKWPIIVALIWSVMGFYFGYTYPRDLEIQSTKPIVLHYEITPEAARALIFKYAEGLKEKP